MRISDTIKRQGDGYAGLCGIPSMVSSLSFAVLQRLQKAGYKCIVSTTKRIVETLDDGSKKVLFKFCKFREY